MPSVDSTTSANWLKTAPTTQFGTRALKFVKIVGSSTPRDFTKQTGSSGAHTDAGSYYSTVIRTVQNFAEIYAVGTPTSTEITVVVADDTQNGADSGNTQATSYGLLEAAIAAAMGAGTYTCTAMDLNGVTLS
jgi:hypothetical protein